MASVSNRTKALKSTPPQPGAVSISKGFQGFQARFQSTDLLGAEIDKWRLERVIGEGGMSAVYEASHQWLKQRAAVKILLPVFYGDDVILQRFQQEALTLSQIQHPHVIEIKDFGEDPAVGYYMVLALLEGCDLHDVIERYAPLPLSWTVEIASQVCQGLHAVHEAGILHRDLKPSNVFLSPSSHASHPHARLLDFGIAKVQMSKGQKRITTTGTIVGTPAYLAPEQVLPRKQMSPATDIYAMGVMLFEMLTGTLPFDSDSSIEHLLMVVNETPPLLGEQRPEFAGSELERLIDQTLAREADARPACAMSLLRALEKAAVTVEDPRELPAHFPVIPTSVPQHAARPETKDRVRYSVQGEQVFADGDDELRQTGGLAEQAFLETLDFPEDEEGERSPLPTEEPVGTVRDEDAAELPPQVPGTLSIKQSTIWRGLLLLSITGLLVGAAFGMWYWQPSQPRDGVAKRPTKPAVRAIQQQPPGARKDPISALLQRARLAYQQEKKALALVLWRQAIDSADDKARPKSGWASHPALWSHTFEVVTAYRKMGRLDSAAALLRRGLQAASQDTDSITRARGLLATIASKINARKPQVDRLFQQLSQRLKRRQWLLAGLSLQALQKLAPDSPQLVLQLIDAVAPAFPDLAKALCKRLLTQLLATPAQRQKARALHKTLLKRLHREEQRFGKWLADISLQLKLPKTWSRGLQLLRSQLSRRSALQHPYGQSLLRRWLKQQLISHPTHGQALWSVYNNAQRQILRGERWLWFKFVMPAGQVPSDTRLTQHGEALRLYQQAHRRLVEAETSMARGRLGVADGKFHEALSSWSRFSAADPMGLQEPHQQRFSRASQWSSRLPSLRLLQQKLLKAMRRGDDARAGVLQKELLALLARSPAQAAVARRLAAWKARQKRQYGQLQRAHTAYQKQRWAEARKLYRSYLRRYPKTKARSEIQRRLKACRCAMKLFAFEICKPGEFPKHYRRGK